MSATSGVPYAMVGTCADMPEIVENLFRFRARLFVDALGWDLSVVNGREVDAFDREDTIYCALYQGSRLVGGFRAIRTDRPYLAESVFPQAASASPYPKSALSWEISRFGVDTQAERFRVSRLLYGLMFRFALDRGAHSLVAVADGNYERFLALIGITSSRFGPPAIIGNDTFGRPLDIVAGEIVIAHQSGPRFEQLVAGADLLEITDATLVRGRRRIPA